MWWYYRQYGDFQVILTIERLFVLPNEIMSKRASIDDYRDKVALLAKESLDTNLRATVVRSTLFVGFPWKSLDAFTWLNSYRLLALQVIRYLERGKGRYIMTTCVYIVEYCRATSILNLA